MRQTLFFIPDQFASVPVFGFGWLLLVWAIVSLVAVVWLVRRQGLNADTRGSVALLAVGGAVIWFLLPRLCEPEGLPIRGFGVMNFLGISAAVALAAYRGRRLGVDLEVIFSMAIWAVVPGILGARLFFVIQYWSNIRQLTPQGTLDLGATFVNLVNVPGGGLVVYGSYIGGTLGLAALVLVRRLPPLAILDLATPSLFLGMAIGRLGCLLNGCCYGGVCDLPWAITFPAGSFAHVRQVETGQTYLYGLKLAHDPLEKPTIVDVQPGSPAEKNGLRPGDRIAAINGRPVGTTEQALWALLRAHKQGDELSVRLAQQAAELRWSIAGPAPRSEPVHPTQIYSAINGLVLCLFLVACAPFRRRDGELLALTFTLYPITRFLLEIIRTDEGTFVDLFGVGLTISQFVSVILFLAAMALWAYLFTRPPGSVSFPTPRLDAILPRGPE